MTSSSRSALLGPTPAARRYFQQFLGELAEMTDDDMRLVAAIESMDQAALLTLGDAVYTAISNGDAPLPGEGVAAALPEGLDGAGLRTALYITLMNTVTRELEIESPIEARAAQGVSIEGNVLPRLGHDHLVLSARFSLDTIQAQKPPDTFQGMVELTVERLSSLVELASQAMMGADVDPFETFEHKDCEKCGHLLQLHVGFESWNDVMAEHNAWCPGRRGA
ncbi:MAG: hypothetical protein OXC55_03505 [Chloroflexi bacterium]|nr:hypothetical protein [Chloroflexota bacterium]